MPARITLLVTEGPLKGQVFTFEEHNTFIFGRDRACHATLPGNDLAASRHHFVLEVNPPHARIRDLGSLNGTFVNDKRYGGRGPSAVRGEIVGSGPLFTDIGDGDRIRVGETVIQVKIDEFAICNRCGAHTPAGTKIPGLQLVEGSLCPACCRDSTAVLPDGPVQVLIPCAECDQESVADSDVTPQDKHMYAPCSGAVRSMPACDRDDSPPLNAPGRTNSLTPCKLLIPGYQIEEMIGLGGMAEVWLARRESDGLAVAVKIMPAKVDIDNHTRESFLREIEVTKALRHPNIVELYDHGCLDDRFFFVMEYCPGGCVHSLLERRKKPLSVEQAAPIMFHILKGLVHLHSSGMVHRDIKPPNILLTSTRHGVAKIADMGLAKNFELAGMSGMTVTGTAVGTPFFMAREQLINFRSVKPVTDIWAACATFYFLLTGQHPYRLRDGESPLNAILLGDLVPIRERMPMLSKSVTKVIEKGLSVRVPKRFQTAKELLAALRKAI